MSRHSVETALRSRKRRALAIAISIGVVGLLQGLVFLTMIEPGPVGLPAIIVAALIHAVPSLLLWLAARTVNQGQPSELGLWTGLAIGLVSGAAFLVSVQSLEKEVRLVTAILAFAAAVVVGYFVLVVYATLLRAAQFVGRFSSDSIAATLACIGAGLYACCDGRRAAGWLYPAAALTFPLVQTAVMALISGEAQISGSTSHRACCCFALLGTPRAAIACSAARRVVVGAWTHRHAGRS